MDLGPSNHPSTSAAVYPCGRADCPSAVPRDDKKGSRGRSHGWVRGCIQRKALASSGLCGGSHGKKTPQPSQVNVEIAKFFVGRPAASSMRIGRARADSQCEIDYGTADPCDRELRKDSGEVHSPPVDFHTSKARQVSSVRWSSTVHRCDYRPLKADAFNKGMRHSSRPPTYRIQSNIHSVTQLATRRA